MWEMNSRKTELLQHALTECAGTYYEVNLTQDLIPGSVRQICDGKEYDVNENIGLGKNVKFSEFVSFWAEKLEEKDREAFCSFTSIPALLERYQKGEAHVSYRFWTQEAHSMSPMLTEFHIRMYQEEELGDILAIAYLVDLTAQYKEQEYKRQLKESLKAEQYANESKTNYLRRISHDIRTPINGILGMMEMSDMYKDDSEKLQDIKKKTQASLNYLLSMVNSILDVGKMESGKIDLEEKPFNLISVLMKQIPILEMQAIDHGLTFRGGREMSTFQHRYLIGSPTHINRLLMNLASNAVKYNRKGGSVTVYCREISSTEDVAVYQFICEDTGIGMSEEFQKHAFDSFAQEGKVEAMKQGSGLGLSIVRQLVDQMNGSIQLESKENVGSRFTVTIPFKINKDIDAANEQEDVPINLSNAKILIADDNEINREVLQMMLEREGALVAMSENGLEALQKFGQSPCFYYDCILMDVTMPVMDGLEAIRQIRALDRADVKEIPIFAMTANAFQEDVQASLLAGATDHLTKPLDIAQVKRRIQNAVSSSKNN